MNRILIALVLASLMMLIAVPPTYVKGATWYIGPNIVCKDGSTPTDFNTVAAALASAMVGNGDLLVICDDLPEPTIQLDITKSVTITGRFSSWVNTWAVTDSDDTNYALGILADTVFTELNLVVNSSTPSNSRFYISVMSSTLVVNQSSTVKGEFKSSLPSTLLYVDSGGLIIDNSVFLDPLNTSNTVINLVDLVDSDINIKDSSLYLLGNNGSVVNGTFDGFSDPLFSIMFDNVFVLSSDKVLAIDAFNSVFGDVLISYSSLYGDTNVVEMSLDGSSITDLSINYTALESIYSDVILLLVTAGSTFDLDVFNSQATLVGVNDVLWTGSVVNATVDMGSRVDGYFEDSFIGSYLVSGFPIGIFSWVEQDSELNLDLYNVSTWEPMAYNGLSEVILSTILDNSIANIFVFDSMLYAADSDLVDLTVTRAEANVDLLFSELFADSDIFDIFTNESSLFTASVVGVNSTSNDFFDARFEDTFMSTEVNDSIIFTDDEGIDVSIIRSVAGLILSNVFMDTHEETIDLYLSDSDASLWVERSYLDSDDEEFLSIFGDTVDLLVNLLEVYGNADDDDGLFYIFYDSMLFTGIYRSLLRAYSSPIDISLYTSLMDMEVSYTALQSVSTSEMNIYAGVSSELNGYINYSNVGVFDITGGETNLLLYESVYNEIDSWRDPGDVVQSIWTIQFYVNSTKQVPLPGTVITLLSGGVPIGSTTAGVGGAATFTVAYFFDPLNPFIADLVFNAVYKGRANITSYLAFEDMLTMPSWYGNITLLIQLFVLKLNVAGDLGYGYLDIEGDEGILRVGSPLVGGWMNTYVIRVDRISPAGNLLLLDISVFYDGMWYKGYIFVNYNTGLVYIRFGGISLYGWL